MQITDISKDQVTPKGLDDNQNQFSYTWPESIEDDLACEIKEMLKSSVFDDSLLGFNKHSTDNDYDQFINNLKSNLATGSCLYLNIRSDDSLVGMSILIPNKSPNCRHIIDITKGYIINKFRGKRAVKGAFKAMIKKCTGSNFQLFTLDVRENSRSHLLWQSFGFEEYGRLEKYALIDGEFHSGVFMQQTIQSLRETVGE